MIKIGLRAKHAVEPRSGKCYLFIYLFIFALVLEIVYCNESPDCWESRKDKDCTSPLKLVINKGNYMPDEAVGRLLRTSHHYTYSRGVTSRMFSCLRLKEYVLRYYYCFTSRRIKRFSILFISVIFIITGLIFITFGITRLLQKRYFPL